ncbi:MAG: helix-turn-helix transcriptional regulator [Planctomycetes bacterium]|nr:helix-turn-helix transcriptional regulator [Planctomycetota bacterium]
MTTPPSRSGRSRDSYRAHPDSTRLQSYWNAAYGSGHRVLRHAVLPGYTLTIAEFPVRRRPGDAPHACRYPTVDIVLRGDGVERYRGEQRRWSPGTVLPYRADAEYYTVEQPVTPRVCKVRATGRKVAGVSDAVQPHDHHRLSRIALRISRTLHDGSLADPLTLESLCEELFAPPVSTPWPPSWGDRVVDYLRAHYLDATPTLEELGRIAGVHPSHLARAFRAWQGCTVGDYLRRLRVDAATRRLMATREPLAEIALSAGFYDQSHFGRLFKTTHGVTPAEFRRQFGPPIR